MTWLALHIGGANLKLADGAGFACLLLELRLVERLPTSCHGMASAIAKSAASGPSGRDDDGGASADRLADKAKVVRFICKPCGQVLTADTRVYLHDGRLVSLSSLHMPTGSVLATGRPWPAIADARRW